MVDITTVGLSVAQRLYRLLKLVNHELQKKTEDTVCGLIQGVSTVPGLCDGSESNHKTAYRGMNPGTLEYEVHVSVIGKR
jgi:hypothetical protein